MSKRFGRNQKRKLMLQLAEQQANADQYKSAYEMADGLQRHVSNQLSEAKRSLEMIHAEITKNLNPYHPLLPNDLRRQITVAGNTEFINVPLKHGSYKVVEMLRRGFVTDNFRDSVAIKVSHGGKFIGYAVDMESLDVATFKASYVNELSQDIAERLFTELSKRGGRL